MPRPQHKRMQYRLYHHLLAGGPMTSHQLLMWYNHDRPQLSPTNTKGAQHGSTIHGISSVLRSSILFEKVGIIDSSSFIEKEMKIVDMDELIVPSQVRYGRGHVIWGARPLDVVVDRAIASRRQLKKFPHFLQEAITEKLQEEE